MTPEQKQWVLDTAKEATTAAHIFPEMSACEAALESDYGLSILAKRGNNLFGMKQHVHPEYGTLSLPTKEYLDGKWAQMTANWVEYPTLVECFEDRMVTLKFLAPRYPHYAEALAATTPQAYVEAVSKTWSTDPGRAAKCEAIYNETFPSEVTPMGLEDEA